jgi:penicillin-binding protein 2
MRVRRKSHYQAIEPDEILVDAANLPEFDTGRLEGRIAQPIGPATFRQFLLGLGVLGVIGVIQLLNLQVREYPTLAARAEANRLHNTLVIAERGLILDRNGVPLAENVASSSSETGLATRRYTLHEAAAHLVGYVTYPKRDQNGYWYQSAIEGVSGAERMFDDVLKGGNGLQISETDATGFVVSGTIVRKAVTGADVRLSVDAGLQEKLFTAIAARAQESGWRGGAGTVMDIETGELIALASYPSFDPSIMSSGYPQADVAAFLIDPLSPLLDRAASGLYTPGSVVKPFIAVAALENNVIDPEKEILSTGSISVPNPYDQKHPSIFKDWREQGWVDMRTAIAYSSDVYFYEVGGGFQDQRGLGIAAIESFMRRFGFGAVTGSALFGEESGTIPNPEWKAENFGGEPWYLGDTYHTAIGQYGFQVTLIQLVRGVAAIASGALVTPVLQAGVSGGKVPVSVSDTNLEIAREGMRLAVTDPLGTAQSLAISGLAVAGKTGTAQVGAKNEFTNSVVIGFFPYEHPRYAFAVVMERAKAGTLQGAPAVMQNVLQWIVQNRPEMAR